MSDISKTDAISGVNGRIAGEGASADERENADAAGTDLVQTDEPGPLSGADSDELEEADDPRVPADEAPSTGVSGVPLDEADARADEADAVSDENTGGGALGGDGVAMHGLENDLAVNDAVAGETVLGDDAAPEGEPYLPENELGDVDLGETEAR